MSLAQAAIYLYKRLNRSIGWHFSVCALMVLKLIPYYAFPIFLARTVEIVQNGGDNAFLDLALWVALYVFLLLINVPLHTLYCHIWSSASREAELDLRISLVRAAISMPYREIASYKAGEVEAKLLRDVGNIHGFYNSWANTISVSIVGLLGSLLYALATEARIAFLICAVVPLCVLLVKFIRKRIEQVISKMRKAVDRFVVRSASFVRENDFIRGSRIGDLVDGDLREVGEKVTRNGRALDANLGLVQSITWVSSQIPIPIVLLFGGYLCLTGSLSLPELVLYQGLAVMIMSYMNFLIMVMPSISSTMDSIVSVCGFLDKADDRSSRTTLRPSGELSADDVCFRYSRNSDYVLQGVNFLVRKGEKAAITGESGSGKSTLLRLMAGIEESSGGVVSIGLEESVAEQLKVGYFSQSTRPFFDQIREYLSFGNPNFSEAKAIELLNKLNVWEKISQREGGLDCSLGDGGGDFSGGQRAKIAFVRILLMKPSIVLLDEPTAFFDDVSSADLLALFDDNLSGSTLVIATHDCKVKSWCDRVFLIEDRVVVEN